MGRSRINLKAIDNRRRILKSKKHFFALNKTNTVEQHVKNAVSALKTLLPECI